jgi:hypothetical protein
MCGKSLKNIFWKFEKSPWEYYISKEKNYFWNKFLYFQSCNYKLFMKIHHVSKTFLYVESIQKKMWIGGFFVSKVLFPYQMFTKSFQFFCEFEYIPQKGIHVFKTFKK